MKKSKKIGIFIIVISILLIILSIGIIIYKRNNQIKTSNVITNEQTEDSQMYVELPEENTVKTFYGTNRPVAVMIDNNKNAWPQYSLNKAYLVYEIIVEGQETRLMALFKNSEVDAIGPIRSSRHYFLDYALENDAIYAHLGWSPQAQSDISKLGVNNINGQVYDSGSARTENSTYWRDTTRSAPHNAFTSLNSLYKIAKDKGYRITSDKKSILNYVTTPVELDTDTIANTVSIPYSSTNIVKYEYNSETGKYERYSKGVKQKDASTGEDIAVKNIIITFAKNYTLTDSENKGRQGLNNIGNLDGYYITNGKTIKIKCEKNSRNEQTVYKDLNGNEIKVNDGNTFIQICPINSNVQIK